jgi:riboflavin kinase/FMN adenylyltransferase
VKPGLSSPCSSQAATVPPVHLTPFTNVILQLFVILSIGILIRIGTFTIIPDSRIHRHSGQTLRELHDNDMSLWFWDATSELPPVLRDGAVTIGNFDAVHRGHQELAARARNWADRLSGPALAITFDPPPHQVLHPGSQRPPLTTLEERAHWLQQAGVDHVIVLHTTRELLSWEAEEFFQRILVGQLRVRALVEGKDFRFGRQRRGDVILLEKWCLQAGCHFEVVPPIILDGTPVSSSRVRQALQSGEVDVAWSLLGRPYSVTGQVVEGTRRGRSLGFPTANLDNVQTLLPANGVYVVQVRAKDLDPLVAVLPTQDTQTRAKQVRPDASACGNVPFHGWHRAAAHIGPNPTFGEQQQKLEVHLIDFQGDLYGQTLRVEFLARLRGIHRFRSVEELKDQLRQDIDAARHWRNHVDQAMGTSRENPA